MSSAQGGFYFVFFSKFFTILFAKMVFFGRMVFLWQDGIFFLAGWLVELEATGRDR